MEGKEGGLLRRMVCIRGRAATADPSTTSITTTPASPSIICQHQAVGHPLPTPRANWTFLHIKNLEGRRGAFAMLPV